MTFLRNFHLEIWFFWYLLSFFSYLKHNRLVLSSNQYMIWYLESFLFLNMIKELDHLLNKKKISMVLLGNWPTWARLIFEAVVFCLKVFQFFKIHILERAWVGLTEFNSLNIRIRWNPNKIRIRHRLNNLIFQFYEIFGFYAFTKMQVSLPIQNLK